MRNHNPVARFYSLAPTRTRAIEAKCAECMGCTKNHIEEGVKKGIRNCTALSCALYFFRPYQICEKIPPQ